MVGSSSFMLPHVTPTFCHLLTWCNLRWDNWQMSSTSLSFPSDRLLQKCVCAQLTGSEGAPRTRLYIASQALQARNGLRLQLGKLGRPDLHQWRVASIHDEIIFSSTFPIISIFILYSRQPFHCLRLFHLDSMICMVFPWFFPGFCMVFPWHDMCQ